MKTRSDTARKCLIFWTLFIGIGAVAGAAGMLADPTGKAMGMDAMLPYFRALPFSDVLFQNYLFSGFALLIVNGLTNLTAAFFLFRKKPIGVFLGGVFGVTLMLWICIQFYMFPINFMSTAYFVFGLCQAVTGLAARIFGKQEAFSFDPADYDNIGRHPERLVVFFSRMGYTKKVAMEEADRIGAKIYEIKATEKTDGTAGFWWCGRYGMHRWAMPIEPLSVDLSDYEHVMICSPIWVFSLASPVRTFCQSTRGKIKEASLITVHYKRSPYRNALSEAEKLLGIPMTAYKSYTCRLGRFSGYPDPKPYSFRVISNQARFGCGYRTIEGERQYFAWHGIPNRNDDYCTTAEISEEEYKRIGKEYPREIVADRETAEVFRKKYVDGHPVILEGMNKLL